MSRVILFFCLFLQVSVFGQQQKIDSLKSLLSTESKEQHAFIYNEISSNYASMELFQKAIAFAQKALETAIATHNADEQYYALTNLAYNYLDLGQIDSALLFGNQALEIAITNEKPTMMARAYNHLGSSYNKIPFFDKALENYLLALRIVDDTLPNTSPERNQFYKSLLLNNIGTVYSKLGQTDKALKSYYQSLQIRRELHDLNGIASCLQNIGVIYEKKENFDSTFILYIEALEIRQQLNQIGYSAELLMNLGILNRKTENFASAEKQLLEAAEIFKKIENKRHLTHAYINLAQLKMATNQPDSALPYILKGNDLAASQGYLIFLKDSYQLLGEYYALKKNYQLAFKYQEKQILLADSVFNTEMTSKVTEMQTRYETERKEKEIAILSKDREIQMLIIDRRTNQVYLLIVAVALVILVLILLLMLLNRRRLKQKHIRIELEKSRLIESKLKEENAYQNKQLTTHALNMLQKNKLLQELDTELKAFAPKADEALQQKLKTIRRQINRNMNSENDWDLFKLYFEEVNRNFFDTLQKKSDSLTTGDLKLAALIKLNLNIKEASAVLNISPDSLRKARYRLRQKLKLYDRENLADYLSRI